MVTKETMKFDTEVDKIFQLMIHSLYEKKEIFLRELISNASDACDKLRYKAITSPELIAEDPEFRIKISVDKDAGTLTIADNGIGMSKAELIKNLGTIARSGTQKFLDKMTGEDKKDTQLIGQFGVGFYSAFMVADNVRVVSKAAGKNKAYAWESKGKNNFTIEETEAFDGDRGTSITLHLSKDEQEYLEQYRLSHIIKTYSNHVAFPIIFVAENGEEETFNDGRAIWLKSKSDIKEEEYEEFYQSIGFMGQDKPWMTLHNKAEGSVEYTNLLFIPSKQPFNLFHPERSCQVKLYVKRVFIAEEGIDIVPPYLRFLRGVLDSEDLPLNISRETVQNSAVLQKIKRSITTKILNELGKKAKNDPEAYTLFWNNFGAVIKEGLCDGLEARDKIIEVCRFRTSTSGDALVSLKEYVERMKKGQDTIYYITADDIDSALNSPQLEGFKAKGIEVLLLTDSVDDFWVNVLHQYQDIPLQSVTRAGVDVKGEPENADSEKKEEANDAAADQVIAFIKEVLGERVADVRTTGKLTESPVCLTTPEGSMDIRMERFMVDNKQLASISAKILEINPSHPVIKKLSQDVENADLKEQNSDLVHLLFAQANIAEGEPVDDIRGFTRRLNMVLEKALAA